MRGQTEPLGSTGQRLPLPCLQNRTLGNSDAQTHTKAAKGEYPMKLWDIYYYITLPIRILLVLIMVLFITDGDFPPIIRDGEYYWYIEEFCEKGDQNE